VRRGAANVAKKLKMRDLERATGVGRETIRFYIREGLLPDPVRPARNVAWYDESFIERIALIKKLRNRYLPLYVIKGIVSGDEVPSEAEMRTLLDLDGKVVASSERRKPHPAEKLSALARRTGLGAAEIRKLADAEAIEIVSRDGDQWLEGVDVAICETWARFRRAGYSEELGFTPKNLRVYVEFSQLLVREELRIFTGGVTGRTDPDTARRMAEEGIEHAGDVLRLIHERLMLRAIGQGNVPAAQENAARDRNVVGE
jgi:DNA-binding transcriptional MerR regulator